MKIGVLTAALQELTPRAVRDTDPDRATEDWLQFAAELGVNYIQLSTALRISGGIRTKTGVAPVGGRPRPFFFPILLIAFMNKRYYKLASRASAETLARL